MNINDMSTQLLYTTVPIWGVRKDNSQISGTGFIFSFQDDKNPNKNVPLLITNYHVLEDVVKGIIMFAVQENGLPIKGKSIRVEFDNSIIVNSKLDLLDLVAIPIGSVLNELVGKNINVFFKSITQDIIPNHDQIDKLAAIEDVTFIGYPSGLFDSYNVSSIIRRGITATPIWNDYNGSPVFIYNQGSYATSNGIAIGSRIFFVGVLTESIVRNNQVFLGLGKVINSVTIFDHLQSFMERLKNR